MSDLTLSLHSLGRTRIPPENPTDAQIAVYIKDLLSLEDGLTVEIRFEIGRTILDMNIEHGEKFDFCKKQFGEGRAKKVLEYAAITRQWVFNQSVGWSWSYYRDFAKLDTRDKQDLVKLYKQNRVKSLAHAKEILGMRDSEEDEKEPVQDQNPHVGILKQTDDNVIDAEYKPIAPALSPPPNTVNPGPWCDECGEPCGDEGTRCLTCIDKSRHPNNLVAVGFHVDGKTVERVTYASPTRLVEATRDTPAYLRQTPPDGLMDNGRQVIGAVCAIPTDDPEIVYIRCVVPIGMTVQEDQLLTVAIVRCQIP